MVFRSISPTGHGLPEHIISTVELVPVALEHGGTHTVEQLPGTVCRLHRSSDPFIEIHLVDETDRQAREAILAMDQERGDEDLVAVITQVGRTTRLLGEVRSSCGDCGR